MRIQGRRNEIFLGEERKYILIEQAGWYDIYIGEAPKLGKLCPSRPRLKRLACRRFVLF